MFNFFKRKPVTEPVKPVKADAFVFNAFLGVENPKETIETLIKMYLKGYHLHKSPPKGVKRIPKVAVTD